MSELKWHEDIDNITLSDYQNYAEQTAIYPKDWKLIYPILGLVGEAGELANKAKKILRDNNGTVTPETSYELSQELGDVLWYVAAVATDLGYNLDDVALNNLEKLFGRKDRGVLGGSGDNR